jgi:carboxymethylenebutenolidase
MRKLITLVLLLLVTVSAFAATGKAVTYKSGNETVTGQIYTPSGKGPFPALVVIHEWWGLNDWVKDQASKLADQGYVTLAVDLYRGQLATTADEAHQLMRGVPQDRAQKDLLAAYDYLASQPSVKKDKIGSIGWCMGGGYSLDLALAQPKVAATVINYGHLVSEDDTVKKIQAPVLGIFGAQDKGIPVDSVRKFEKDLKAQGKDVQIVIYDDAGHAFENPNNKDGYRAADAQDAWKKTIAFLARNLKPAGQ